MQKCQNIKDKERERERAYMEGEINNFIMVWASIFASIGYCYAAAKVIPKGTARLITFSPVVSLFLLLPFHLHSINLGLATIFFITWLGNSKLLLFAFGVGPLSDPSLSLGRFVALACLPIKIQMSPSSVVEKPHPEKTENLDNGPNKGSPSRKTSTSNSKSGLKSPLSYATKALLLSFLVLVNEYYRENLHPKVVLFLVCTFIFIGVEFTLAMVAILARAMLGLELEPQFNDPYLSTSLQNFWGYRWNLMSSDILRLTVHSPICQLFRPTLGRKWASMAATLVAFFVSGLMHELKMYYLCRVRPTWGATWYFIIHGLCLVVERHFKDKFTTRWRWRLPQPISRLVTVGFVVITFIWLMLPQLVRFKVDLRAIEEYKIVATFVKDIGRASTLRQLFNTTNFQPW